MKITFLDSTGVAESEKLAFNRLEEVLPKSWQGYGSYQMYQRTEKFDLDLIIISDDRIIVAELKNWYGEVVLRNNDWIQMINGVEHHNERDVVGLAAKKARILASKIEKKIKQTNKLSYTPFVQSCVVMCGSAKYDTFPEEYSEMVFSLDDFSKIGKKTHFKKCFPLHAWIDKKSPPNSKIKIWNEFFLKNTPDFKPKKFSHNGYIQHGDAFFQHSNDIYSEFKANQNQYKAILRRWNWEAEIISKKTKTEKDRLLFSERESKVLHFIDNQFIEEEDSFLSNLHLEYIPSPSNSPEAELYKLPNRLETLSNYSNNTLSTWTTEKRITTIKIFLSNLSRLHQIGVAHRDIGAHSVWISPKSTRMLISNFIAATYPDDPNKKFIRELRDTLLHVKTPTPEDLYDDDSGTPFTRDVYLAASVAHYLAFSKWPDKQDDVFYWSPVDEDEFDASLNDWFFKALELEPKNRFTNISSALDSFNGLTKKNHRHALNDDLLEDIKKYEVVTDPYDIYAHNRLNTSNSPMVFQSNDGYGLKLWTGVSQTNADTSINFQLLSFLDYINSLIKSKNPVVPNVKEFGYNDLFKFAFIAYEWVEGENWNDFIPKVQLEEVPSLILQLLKSVEKLHKNKIFLGSISPEKIICEQLSDSFTIKFTDLFDRFASVKEAQDEEFSSDDTIQTISQATQDRLSIINIVINVAEIFNLEYLKENCESIITENGVSEGDFTNLIDNFNESLTPPEEESDLEEFVIAGWSLPKIPEVLASDEGSYYISIYQANKPHEFTLLLTGRKYSIKFFVDIENRKIAHGYKPELIQHSDFMINKRRGIELRGSIQMVNDRNFIADDFLEFIFNNERAIKAIDKIKVTKTPQPETTDLKPQLSESISTIWKTSIDTEFSTYPRIHLINSPKPEGNNLYSVQFSLISGNPDFDLSRGSNETVFILKIIENRNAPWICGRIIKFDQGIGKSTGEMIYKVKERNRLEEGNELLLESNLIRSSLSKRKTAMDSILNERSVISDLAKYFDPNEICSVTEFTEEHPTDEELDQYSTIGLELNESQRQAFKKLYSYGPLGLLQGPPGTGKTAFIGAFVHYAINKGAKRILVISQSHEAVNGAAEKVREIFEKLNQDVSIVRFGDEVNLSESLEDISETALQDQYRELFRAEIKQRIINISNSLNLEDGFIHLAVEFELSFGQNLKSLIKVSENSESLNKEDLEHQNLRVINLLNKIDIYLSNNFDYKGALEITNLDDVSDLFYKLLANKYDIHSPSRIAKFRNIVNMSIEWIGVMSSSTSKFQNFLAKTRSVVCGTCVGIGRNHYGIEENIYDLVIIDEAARATSSELAISMNVGERVVLVGDHKQLKPFIHPDHMNEIEKRLPNISQIELRRSDFERSILSNYGKEIGHLLSTQYRMAIPIGNLVSDCFYDGSISTDRGYSDEVFDSLPENLGSTVTWIDTADAGEQSLEHKFDESQYENKYEVDLIINLIKKLINEPILSNYLKPNNISPQIGVICMYSGQLNLLNRKAQSLQWFRNLINSGVVKIDTVDSYQGKENSIIITSLVRNNLNEVIGFLDSKNRANVSLSRAKERLYIVGSSKIWTNKNTNSSFGEVLTYIENNDPSYYKVLNSKDLGENNEKTH
jgi:superfamily I DNA and/or RNA helicase/serine/threonine protein kinase